MEYNYLGGRAPMMALCWGYSSLVLNSTRGRPTTLVVEATAWMPDKKQCSGGEGEGKSPARLSDRQLCKDYSLPDWPQVKVKIIIIINQIT